MLDWLLHFIFTEIVQVIKVCSHKLLLVSEYFIQLTFLGYLWIVIID